MKKFLAALLFVVLAASLCFASTEYPVTIENGNRKVTFYSAPNRVITNCDGNIIEMLLALGLRDKIIGYAGPFTEDKISPEYRWALSGIPALSKKYIDFKTLYKAKPDLFISGYKYGLDTDKKKGLTPEVLAKNFIKTYAITDSTPVSLENIYTDIENLGIIFDVQDKAEDIIYSMKVDADIIVRRVSAMNIRKPLNVFIYTGCDKSGNFLCSVGNKNIVNSLLEMVKAHNIFSDVNDSDIQVQWQDVIKRNPDVIIILESCMKSGEKYKQAILRNPLLKRIKAVRNKRIQIVPIENVYQGVRAVKGLELITRSLYPEYRHKYRNVNRYHRFNRHYLRRCK